MMRLNQLFFRTVSDVTGALYFCRRTARAMCPTSTKFSIFYHADGKSGGATKQARERRTRRLPLACCKRIARREREREISFIAE